MAAPEPYRHPVAYYLPRYCAHYPRCYPRPGTTAKVENMSEKPADTPPSRPWTVEGFELFWSYGRDARMVAPVVWPDVIGKWPAASAPVVGRAAYIGAIANFLAALGDFTVEVTDHAINDDIAFVRWIVRGDFGAGPDHIVGVDRLVLKEGYVIENHIHSDHPIFAELAQTRALG